MYTLLMSWPFRALALSVAALWIIAPQLACFMPDELLTEPEMECCRQMAMDCGGMSMTQPCCRHVSHTDVGIASKALRHPAPQFMAIEITDRAATPPVSGILKLSFRNAHAPPHDPQASSLALRI